MNASKLSYREGVNHTAPLSHSPSVPARDPEFWRAQLRAAGLRATAQRLAVLEVLEERPHATAADVAAAIQLSDPGAITLQGVHVALQQLAAHHLIRRVDLPDSSGALWETRVGDNHHHMQCVMCGRIEDVDCVVGQAPCLTPSDGHGMRLLEAEVIFRGICAECDSIRAATEVASDRDDTESRD